MKAITSERKKAVAAADREFSRFIRARDGRCVTCGTTERLQCGHLFSRSNYSLRWDERNAYCQCASCNMRHEYDPAPLTMYYLSLYSQEDYVKLHATWRGPTKFTTERIREIAAEYRSRVGECRWKD